MQTCSLRKKTRILVLWDGFFHWGLTCLNVLNLLIRACWEQLNLLETFHLLLWWSVLVNLSGGRVSIPTFVFSTQPYIVTLICHTYLYSVSHCGFLMKNKFLGIFFVTLGVRTVPELSPIHFLPMEYRFSWVDKWLLQEFVNWDYNSSPSASINTSDVFYFFFFFIFDYFTKASALKNKLIWKNSTSLNKLKLIRKWYVAFFSDFLQLWTLGLASRTMILECTKSVNVIHRKMISVFAAEVVSH